MWGHCSVGYGAKVTGFLSLNVIMGLNGTVFMLGFVSFCFKVVEVANFGCSERKALSGDERTDTGGEKNATDYLQIKCLFTSFLKS